ncbi:hypothetical protein NPIL_188421 [Nephila pilipes]|uniref:Uncharacterized protein n=1 Tax=Nephila pilipes TaxID=299642 RepID=A0A8X6U4P6_NEPPI|nr:hypothetical protein NPIL_188421 [Nephila pilipes]
MPTAIFSCYTAVPAACTASCTALPPSLHTPADTVYRYLQCLPAATTTFLLTSYHTHLPIFFSVPTLSEWKMKIIMKMKPVRWCRGRRRSVACGRRMFRGRTRMDAVYWRVNADRYGILAVRRML